MVKIELFKLVGTLFIDTDKAQDSLHKVDKKTDGFASKLGKGIKTAGKWGLAIGGACAAVGGAMLGVAAATEEYRNNMAKLTTAFESTGKSAGDAQTAYTELYKVLGDSDQATEATQLLSNLATTQEDVATWADISAGVVGRFGDSLPIESLIEASNETAKVGQVTGALADALNWAGISEEEFNAKLSACGTEKERNRLITETLSLTYQDASNKFRENNQALIEAREAQAQLQEATGNLGGAVDELKNKFVAEFGPAISDMINAFADLVRGTEGAREAFADSLKNMEKKIAENLPKFIEGGIEIITALGEGLIEALPSLIASIPRILKAIVKGFAKLASALFKVGKDAMEGLWDGLKSVWTDICNWVTSKVNWIKDKLSSWRSALQEMAEGAGETKTEHKTTVPKPHAGGLPYVPYDGYKAELHKGETVLTANSSRTMAEDIINGLSGVLQGNQGGGNYTINLVVDKKTMAQVLFDPLREVSKQRGVALG